jgi:hypothetical protein
MSLAPAPWSIDTNYTGKMWTDSLSIKDAEGGLVAHLTRGYDGDEKGDDGPSWNNASLIAAAPTMREYISKCAASGDVEAAQILDSIDVRGINKNISPEERERRRKWMSDFRRAAIVKAIGEHKDAGTDTA